MQYENRTPHPMKVRVHVEGRPLLIEIDTGAAVSLISKTVWKKEFPQVHPIQNLVHPIIHEKISPQKSETSS